MGVGQLVTKQTWLLDGVEVKGIVRVGGRAEGEEVGTQDDFDVEPAANYRHLIASFPANNPLYWNPGVGCMHCETYPLPPEHVNRVEPWPLDTKPGDVPFDVMNPATGQREPLRVGAHIRVVGRWTIDHHPESCVTRDRGWLRVGCAHTELHPFRWDQLELVVDPAPGATVTETLSLAAPLHEEVYLGQWKWLANELAGVASKIFVADDASNYHNELSASVQIFAPPLPAGWTRHASLIGHRESVLRNGTGMSLSLIRTITATDDGIRVDATVTASGSVSVNGHNLGDVDDPARLRSVFQAQYSVGWAPRLMTGGSIALETQQAGDAVAFATWARNRGPDPLEAMAAWFDPNPDGAFVVQAPLPRTLAPDETLSLSGTFTPPHPGTYSGNLVIQSNDPAHPMVLVPITGITRDAPPSHRLSVSVQPTVIAMGREVQVGVYAEDTGNHAPVAGTVTITNYDRLGKPQVFNVPTNVPFARTFMREKEFDPDIKRWIPGEPPSGVVNAAGYEADPDAPVPFVFR